MIRVCVEVPAAFEAAARYALVELAARWGTPITWSDPSSADLVYASPERLPHSATLPNRRGVQIEFDERLYRPATCCGPTPGSQGRTIWRPSESRGPGASSGADQTRPRSGGPGPAPDLTADLIGGTFRLLALLDESQIGEEHRDRRGAFVIEALPEARRSTINTPLVEHHADEIWDRLAASRPGLIERRLPRWPRDSSLAVALSHDADSVHLGAPVEFVHNLLKAARRRDPHSVELALASLQYVGRMRTNPAFGFDRWRSWEDSIGIRSAFYLYHRPAGVRWDRDDCRSSVAGLGMDWGLLRAMEQEGWEFGLHPSIHVKEVAGAFARAKAWLEERLQAPISGLRHHFWALDWRRPYRTQRDHAAAGFEYDSSIAWRDAAGFRAGTCLPYRPWDPEHDRAIGLLVLPCTLMDRHVTHVGASRQRKPTQEALTHAREFTDLTRGSRGLLTPNWHQETIWNRNLFTGFFDVIAPLMSELSAQPETWCATPRDVARHWQKRLAQVAPDQP